MRIALTSDTHLNITTKGQLKVMFKAMAEERFDVLVHAGDYCGAGMGHKSVRPTLELMRQFMPDKPILSVIGNHELYCLTGTRIPSREDFDENKAKLKEVFLKYNVHHLDYDGIYVHPEHSTVKVMGATGWYNNPKPPTADDERMPRSPTGSIHYELSRYYHDVFEKNLKLLDEQFDKAVDTLVFVSHFPVMAQKENDKKFDQFGGNPMIAELLRNDYGCKYFLNGHSHLFANGTNGQYVCGADYYNPKYLIIEVN